MALNLISTYPEQVELPDVEYPLGKARNVTSPDDNYATPLDESWMNDLYGWQQALLSEAGLTPSGVPDNALRSQYLDAIKIIVELYASKKASDITYTPRYGSVERSVAEKNNDIISILGYASADAAYNDAVANDLRIYVPAGDYSLDAPDPDMSIFYGTGSINGQKLTFDPSTHKTIFSYPGDAANRVNAAFSDDSYAEVNAREYAALNSNPHLYSFGLATPRQKSPENIINIVDNADKIPDISQGNNVAQRWDLAFAYPQKPMESIPYHPFPSGFYIMPDYTHYYVWHKPYPASMYPPNGYKGYLVKKTMAGKVVSEVEFDDNAARGETFTVIDDRLYMGGTLQAPAYREFNINTGVQSDYYKWGGVTFSSRQFAYRDPKNQDRIIVFARKSGVGFGIFEYDITKFTTDAGVKTLTLQKELSIPDVDESKLAIQGFTAIGQTAYMVCEDIGVSANFRVKYLYTWRLTDGKLIEIKNFNPNGVYRGGAKYGDATKGDGNYESEGLQAQINTSQGKASSVLFAGLITGTGADTVSTKYRFLVFQSAIGGENAMVPVVQGMPIRGGLGNVGNTGGGYIQQYYITLHKLSGNWRVYEGNYEAAVSQHTVQDVEVVSSGGSNVLAFYLMNVFLSRVNAHCSVNRLGYHAFVDRGVYGGSGGGGGSAKQVVVLSDHTGALVDPNVAPDGLLIEVSLTVISG